MKIGFIGAGNMANAIIDGVIDAKYIDNESIYLNTRTMEKAYKIHDKYNIKVVEDKVSLVENVDIIILAVKPNQYENVIEQIRNCDINNKIVVSIAAGVSIGQIEGMFSKEVKVVRCMPNTPVGVGEGMTAICANNLVTSEELVYIVDLFNTVGKAEIIDEKLMDAVVAVSGSSPAYVYMMIEAMADAAVLEGMPRDKAYVFAAQAVLGSAKMVLETGVHPGKLKDNVCSPGGTTIEAVKVLENKGFRSSIIDAMVSCAEKSKNM